MVKYMYADSTEFPLQRDFIDILERYADMYIEAMPTQQQIIELKEGIRATENEKSGKLSRIEDFEARTNKSIDDVASGFGEGGFSGVSDAIKGDVGEEVRLFREAEEKLFNEKLKTLNSELSKRQKSLLHILGEFLFYDPLEISEVQVDVDREGKSYVSTLRVICSSGVDYSFRIDFSKKEMKVEDFIKKTVHVPSAMKPTMLSKEKKPHLVEINDWILSKAQYRSNAETTLNATLQKNHGNEKPRIEMVIRPGESKIQCLNFVDDDGNVTDIMKDEQLRKSIDGNFEEFTKYLLGHFFGLLDEKKQILSASMDGKSLAEEDLTSDFAMRVAAEYSKTVGSIRDKGLVENELNLKAEDLEGKRTEIYLKIDEFKAKMASIPQGTSVCSELGLD
jgi:hypothetical protein